MIQRKKNEEFTLQTCAVSEEFAVYVKGEIKIGTLGASHATHGFAQLHDERPCALTEISEHGVMSKAKCFTDPGIENAVTNGMEYFVFRWEVEHDFPEIPDIVQSALNTVSQVCEGSYMNNDFNTCNNSYERMTIEFFMWKMSKIGIVVFFLMNRMCVVTCTWNTSHLRRGLGTDSAQDR